MDELILTTCSKRLKLETKEVHSEAERLIIKKLNSTHSIEDYINFLKLFYGFFYPLEILARTYIKEEVLKDISKRGNTKKIMHDIEILAGDKIILLAPHLPPVTNVLQAFGVMYVMEGSTLGGQIITKMLRDKNITCSNMGLSFFEGYGENTLAMWKSFTACLDAYFQTERQIEQIVLTARETFMKMKEWILTNDLLANETSK